MRLQSEISPSTIERERIRIINRSEGYRRGARVTFVHILYKAKRSSRTIIERECQNDWREQRREFQIKQCHATSGQLNKVMSSCQLKKIILFNKCQFLTNVCIRMIFISHVPVISDASGVDTIDPTAPGLGFVFESESDFTTIFINA